MENFWNYQMIFFSTDMSARISANEKIFYNSFEDRYNRFFEKFISIQLNFIRQIKKPISDDGEMRFEEMIGSYFWPSTDVFQKCTLCCKSIRSFSFL